MSLFHLVRLFTIWELLPSIHGDKVDGSINQAITHIMSQNTHKYNLEA